MRPSQGVLGNRGTMVFFHGDTDLKMTGTEEQRHFGRRENVDVHVKFMYKINLK